MGRPPGYNRDAVLLAAERQFRRCGYAATTLDDISAATGLGRGSLYGAFGDKHALFLLTLDGYATRTGAVVAEILGGPDDGALERLRTFLVESALAVAGDADRFGCMAGQFALELEPGADRDASTRIEGIFRTLQAALTECVAAAQRYGDLDPQVPASEIAGLILALSRGFDVVARGGVPAADLEAAARRAFAGLPFAPGRRATEAGSRSVLAGEGTTRREPAHAAPVPHRPLRLARHPGRGRARGGRLADLVPVDPGRGGSGRRRGQGRRVTGYPGGPGSRGAARGRRDRPPGQAGRTGHRAHRPRAGKVRDRRNRVR
jgi:TetR/AcrR family transcriptional regulator, transcriptional repressor for nem operon